MSMVTDTAQRRGLGAGDTCARCPCEIGLLPAGSPSDMGGSRTSHDGWTLRGSPRVLRLEDEPPLLAAAPLF
jgi:hypothetical protein